jgi:hypothetical protein
MKFTVPGFRDSSDGSLTNVGDLAMYWVSSVIGPYARYRNLGIVVTSTNYDYRAYAVTVRCIKN